MKPTEFWKEKKLENNFIAKIPAVSCKHLHRGCLNDPTTHLHWKAILLLLKKWPEPGPIYCFEDNLQIRWCYDLVKHNIITG
jgi:hypothetical protein